MSIHIVYTRTSDLFNDSRATKEIMALLDAGFYVHYFGWNRTGHAVTECKKVFGSCGKRIILDFYDETESLGFFSKLLRRFSWWRWLYQQLDSEKQIDIIHACDLDTGVIVKRFCKKNKTPYIYDIYDYFADAHVIPLRMNRFVEYIENKVINNADATIICSEERREQIKKACPKQIEIIHNSPDIKSVGLSKEEKFDYAYCGTLCNGRLIEEIFELYGENADLKFVVAGSGCYAELAKRLDAKFENFTFLGSISYKEVLNIEGRARVLSAIYDSTIKNHKFCAPNKFYESLALGKPIIVCKNTGIDKMVKENDIGEVISYDAKEFYAVLRRIVRNRDAREKVSMQAKGIYLDKYSWEIMKKKLVDIYKTVALKQKV